jgi:hypothetical protein
MQASRRRTLNRKCVTPARWGNRGAAHGADSNTELFTDAPGDGCIGKTTEGSTMNKVFRITLRGELQVFVDEDLDVCIR